MDKRECLAFVAWQFRRLGMYEGSVNEYKKRFIEEIEQGRTQWLILCRVVHFVEEQLLILYGSVR